MGHPQTRIRIFYFLWVIYFFKGTVNVRAWFVIVLMLVPNVLSALEGDQGQVAYWAHLGGVSVGLLATTAAVILSAGLGILVTVYAGVSLVTPQMPPPCKWEP